MIVVSICSLSRSVRLDTFTLVFSKYPFWWDRVGIYFSGRVPGYSRRWAIIGYSTKIFTFTNLKLTQMTGSNHLLYFSSATLFAFKKVRHRRSVNQEKISVHSKHGCLLLFMLRSESPCTRPVSWYPPVESFDRSSQFTAGVFMFGCKQTQMTKRKK